MMRGRRSSLQHDEDSPSDSVEWELEGMEDSTPLIPVGRDGHHKLKLGNTPTRHHRRGIKSPSRVCSHCGHSSPAVFSEDPGNARHTETRSYFDIPMYKHIFRRALVLVVLMLLQSISSIILSRFQPILSHHVIITLFLTMLVGAGGNAGNQSSVMVIRGLATGELNKGQLLRVLAREALIGLSVALIMIGVGYVRIIVLHPHAQSAEIVSLVVSLFTIVFVSVIIGTTLPMLFVFAGSDPAHAGPTIQVVMDIVGVLCTCVTFSVLVGVTTGHATDPELQ